jgi:hypothetical protein
VSRAEAFRIQRGLTGPMSNVLIQRPPDSPVQRARRALKVQWPRFAACGSRLCVFRPVACGGLVGRLGLARQLRELGEVLRHAAGLVLSEQLGHRAPTQLVLESYPASHERGNGK